MDIAQRLQALGVDPATLIQTLALPVEPFTVFLSGSVIEGYGNAESDLDIYVVYPQALPTMRADIERGTNNVTIEYTDEWKLDVESWIQEEIFSLTQRVQNASDDDPYAYTNLRLIELDLAHRIRIGLPLYQEAHFFQMQQAFNYQRLSHLIAMRNVIAYTGSAKDAAGAIASQQCGTALLTARQTVAYAMDALVAASGETNIKEKWRFQKVRRLQDATIYQRYWELETAGIASEPDALEYAKRCLRFAQHVVVKAQRMLHARQNAS